MSHPKGPAAKRALEGIMIKLVQVASLTLTGVERASL
jgi:hypothetical protein